jgi:predicted RNA methylase
MNLDLRHDLQRHLGLYEREISHVFEDYARRINTAVDVGAGDGYYTLYFLAKTPAKKVLGFEPSQEAQKQMEFNLRANGLGHDGRLVLSSRSVGSCRDGETTTLESILEAIEPPCLIKIDVEGAEADVLAGAGRVLDFPDVRWIVETHSRSLEGECERWLTHWGYETVIVPTAWWRVAIPELRPIPHNRWLCARTPRK